MPIYNKLVRDRIPEIIVATNKKYSMKVLEPAEHEVEIKRKLIEELKEYQEATSNEEAIEELADLLELIYAVLPLHGTTIEELEEVRVKKLEKRGGFDNGYYLIEVEDD
ncbi:nucleoside triphosphate pyrophosphohydrolase [Paenisporosarcina antarctica]|uniref:Phosphoribosyl-ATP pyrophosphohydrolase n=1 Tax=Paenisporosarcina antarctica TaxID=417367 RepID=A0A4P7A1B7_9BACL|nr:nucleoside triphosphate pyrophosphohydrolase [Paenisporosarcina antarctica]QBP42691.1 phosphoribosyl-ATP pyrophosphohydrolase [Paenisporosarcina antarctica]